MNARTLDNWKLAGAILVIALAILGCILGGKLHARHVDACHKRGGNVTSYTEYHHGHSNTVHKCFLPNGGQIDEW